MDFYIKEYARTTDGKTCSWKVVINTLTSQHEFEVKERELRLISKTMLSILEEIKS